MLVLNLPFKALMFLTLMRPSLVLFLVLWLKLVKDLDRKSGSAGMPRPISYAVFCLKKKKNKIEQIRIVRHRNCEEQSRPRHKRRLESSVVCVEACDPPE